MDLMEDKRLNFNQPLLSARRGSSTKAVPEVDKRKTSNTLPSIPPLPYYKPELKSGPVCNPGVVPFQWEQCPGRPKDETKQSQSRALDPPFIPKLPPGRAPTDRNKNSDKSLKDSHACKPQLELDASSTLDTSFLHKNTAKFEKLQDDREEDGSSGSGDENSTYFDALDTLSRCDSFLNCSLSGHSGLDGPGLGPTGTFLDPQARDFMMCRFLPAAKAVASDNSQLESMKQSVAKEEAPDVKKYVIQDRRDQGNFCLPESLAYPLLDDGVGEVNNDDNNDQDDFSGTENFSSAKLCGLLPHFCLLIPIPGMRDSAPVQASSAQKIHKKPENIGAHMKTETKAIVDAVYERRSLTVYQRSGIRVGHDAGSLKNELKKLPFKVDSPKLDELSKNANSGGNRGNIIAPYRSLPRHSLMRKEKGFLGIPEVSQSSFPVERPSIKKNMKLRELFLSEEPSQNANHAIVKIHSAQETECQYSSSSSSDSRSLADSQGRTLSIDYSVQDIDDLCSTDEKEILQSRSMVPVDCGEGSALVTSDPHTEKRQKDFPQMEEKLKPFSSMSLKKQDAEILDANFDQLPMLDDKKGTILSKKLIPPPPLPKSPSQSWLARALPSAPSKNTHSITRVGVRNQRFRASPVDPKWENVVKSSNSHRKLSMQLTPISES